MLSDEEKENLIKKLRYCEQEYEQNGYLSVGKFEAIKQAANLIEKQSKEIEELKEKNKTQSDCAEPIERTEEMVNMKWVNYNYVSKDKIKAKIGEKMQKNNNIIHNAKIEYGKDYYWYDDVQDARKENDIYKDVMQSLLEKE